MNRTALINHVRLITNASTNLVSDTQITNLLNAGQQEFQQETEFLETSNLQDIVADQAGYNVPSDFIKLLWVEYNADPLTPTNQHDLAMYNVDWRTDEAAEPTHYYLDAGNSQVVLYPIPTTAVTAVAATSAGLRMEYVYQPADLANASDVPSLPADMHMDLAYYAAAHVFMRDNEPASFDRYMGMWAAKIKKFKLSRANPDRNERFVKRSGRRRGFGDGLRMGDQWDNYTGSSWGSM